MTVGPSLTEACIPHTLHPIFLQLGNLYWDTVWKVGSRSEAMVSSVVRLEAVSPDSRQSHWASEQFTGTLEHGDRSEDVTAFL
jgi:hypothetical protein